MSDAVVRLKIVLEHTEPAIWRRVEVPADITLKDLHDVIQAAMGWENAHLFLFHVGRQTVAGPGLTDLTSRDGERAPSSLLALEAVAYGHPDGLASALRAELAAATSCYPS